MLIFEEKCRYSKNLRKKKLRVIKYLSPPSYIRIIQDHVNNQYFIQIVMARTYNMKQVFAGLNKLLLDFIN